MPEIWFTADPHYRHANVLNFKDAYGQLIRPEFTDVDEMDEYLLNSYNSFVSPKDTVYFVGDITFRKDNRMRQILNELNGVKTLILGNHDDAEWLSEWFPKIRLWRKFLDVPIPFVATHMPVRNEELLGRRGGIHFNVHGHIHEKEVLKDNGQLDDHYLNVGVELCGYEPIHIEDIQSIFSLTPTGSDLLKKNKPIDGASDSGYIEIVDAANRAATGENPC